MAAPKSPNEMFQVMKANIAEKTGKSFDEWLKLAKQAGITKFKARTDHMKSEHGMTHGYAQLVAWGVIDPARLEATNDDVSMVDALYTGKKEHLRPVHDNLIATGERLGRDVEKVICKTYTSLRSKSQFAMVVSKTNSAVDLELAMPAGTEATGRLEAIRSSNPRITHRIRLSGVDKIDAEVESALRTAWEHNRSGS